MQQKPGSLMQSLLGTDPMQDNSNNGSTYDPSKPLPMTPPSSAGVAPDGAVSVTDRTASPLPDGSDGTTPNTPGDTGGTQTTLPTGPKIEDPVPPASTPPTDTPPASHYNTHLMEGDPGKMTPEHAATSPKYDFLNLAKTGKYNYNQMSDMLKELQSGPNGRLWQGWTADGKGNFVFTGDPSQLAKEWNGVTRVDAVGSYGNLSQGKDPAGWRWGADEGGSNGAQSNSTGAVDGSNVPSLEDYYNGANSGNGGTGTQMDPNQLKSILQKYYGNAANQGGINLGAGTTVR